MKKVVLFLAVATMLFCTGAFALETKAIIVGQKNIPVSITGYEAEYKRGTTYTPEGIHHTVKYRNNGTKKIEAIQFGLVSFDVWNEYLDRTMGLSLDSNDPGDSEKGTWITRVYSDFAFLTGLAYVSRIRYADGTIWKADLEEVSSEINKIQKDFDIKQLEAKPEKK